MDVELELEVSAISVSNTNKKNHTKINFDGKHLTTVLNKSTAFPHSLRCVFCMSLKKCALDWLVCHFIRVFFLCVCWNEHINDFAMFNYGFCAGCGRVDYNNVCSCDKFVVSVFSIITQHNQKRFYSSELHATDIQTISVIVITMKNSKLFPFSMLFA